MTERGIKKVRTGVVLKKSSDKTIMVEVERLVMHRDFKKYIRKRKKFAVHDPKNECQAGDIVTIVESRPISKLKRWKLQGVVKKNEMIEE